MTTTPFSPQSQRFISLKGLEALAFLSRSCIPSKGLFLKGDNIPVTSKTQSSIDEAMHLPLSSDVSVRPA